CEIGLGNLPILPCRTRRPAFIAVFLCRIDVALVGYRAVDADLMADQLLELVVVAIESIGSRCGLERFAFRAAGPARGTARSDRLVRLGHDEVVAAIASHE